MVNIDAANEQYRDTPWGSWTVLDDRDNFKVKKIIIKPRQRLSYQKHMHREENWFVVQGEAEITLNDIKKKLVEGDFIHIPLEAKHRIENISRTIDLIFIEIQRGTYFGEDDIERFADDYGRN